MTRILNREFDLEAARRLHEEGYLPPVARALSARGIRDASELAQDWKSMLPPAMLEGTREAAERLALARERGERLTVVADYDCDGATACAVAIRGLGMMGVKACLLYTSQGSDVRLLTDVEDIEGASDVRVGIGDDQPAESGEVPEMHLEVKPRHVPRPLGESSCTAIDALEAPPARARCV